MFTTIWSRTTLRRQLASSRQKRKWATRVYLYTLGKEHLQSKPDIHQRSKFADKPGGGALFGISLPVRQDLDLILPVSIQT